MAKSVKMCDLGKLTAGKVFEMINGGKVRLEKDRIWTKCYIVTDVEPKDLTYPEGWYYAKGCFRNKHTSTTGIYEEIPMRKPNGESWGEIAKYCTLID